MKEKIGKISVAFCIVYLIVYFLHLVLPVRLYIETDHFNIFRIAAALSGVPFAVVSLILSSNSRVIKAVMRAVMVLSLITGFFTWLSGDMVYDSTRVVQSPDSGKKAVISSYYVAGIPRAQLYSYHLGFLIIKKDYFVRNSMGTESLGTPDVEWSEDDNLTVTFHIKDDSGMVNDEILTLKQSK